MAEKIQRGEWVGEEIDTDSNVIVHQYEDHEQFQATAAVMSERGWKVQSVTESRPRPGCLRIATLWWFSLLFPPKPRLVVTYVRDEQNRTRRRRRV